MEIYEYVHSIGNRIVPTYEIEEDGKEYRERIRLYSIVPHKDGKLDMSKFPFTKEQFLENTFSNSFVTGIGHRHRKILGGIALCLLPYTKENRERNGDSCTCFRPVPSVRQVSPCQSRWPKFVSGGGVNTV